MRLGWTRKRKKSSPCLHHSIHCPEALISSLSAITASPQGCHRLCLYRRCAQTPPSCLRRVTNRRRLGCATISPSMLRTRDASAVAHNPCPAGDALQPRPLLSV
ncbi:hypothetical protein M0R45_008014 [Rubus argutus]|uniref:Uncharacterized protein n=1 Tax=Rubus argutus TaxID=59490 RepID=A0AAW1Y2E5_RUBAR